MSRSLHPSARIVKVYIEALTGCSCIHSPAGLNNTLLSQGCVLENGSHYRNNERNVYSKVRGGDKSLQLPRSSSRVNWQSFPLDDLLQHDLVPSLLEEKRCSDSPATE